MEEEVCSERWRLEATIWARTGWTRSLQPEISRFTSKPEEQGWKRAKRLARYLKNNKRMVTEHDLQKLPKKVVVRSDTDFAGCKRGQEAW